MTVPDEAIEAAVLMLHTFGGLSVPEARERAQVALEAAAPYLRAQALENAADAFENLPMNTGPEISSGTWEWFELFPIEHLHWRAVAERGGE